jgi:hypothetical protein
VGPELLANQKPGYVADKFDQEPRSTHCILRDFPSRCRHIWCGSPFLIDFSGVLSSAVRCPPDYRSLGTKLVNSENLFGVAEKRWLTCILRGPCVWFTTPPPLGHRVGLSGHLGCPEPGEQLSPVCPQQLMTVVTGGFCLLQVLCLGVAVGWCPCVFSLVASSFPECSGQRIPAMSCFLQ